VVREFAESLHKVYKDGECDIGVVAFLQRKFERRQIC
jgi:hypothetical protein